MSRTNKPRAGGVRGSHQYRSKNLGWPKWIGNKWMRQHVRQLLKSKVVDDDFQERIPDKRYDLFNRWYYD